MGWMDDERIHEVFTAFDLDGSGVLEKKELRNALFLLGIDLTAEELESTYCLDDDPDSFTEEEFTKLIKEKIGDVNFKQRLSESLLEFDVEGSGLVSRDKMKEILTMRGTDPMDDAEVEDILNQLPFDESDFLNCSALTDLLYNADDGINMTE